MAYMTNSRYASNIFTDRAPTAPAVCIPRVFKNITEQRILAIFRNLDLGDIVRIDMVPRQNEQSVEYWRVFVHIAWSDSKNSTAIRRKMEENGGNGEVKIVYDEPWYWKMRASRERSVNHSSRNGTKTRRPLPFIDFEESTTSNACGTQKQGSTEERKHVEQNAQEEMAGITSE